ncbi:hypothetical protein [Streptomyces sp. NPDC093105]|uniref:hypothetical protein n=1 Tax=Streptomyces sp. NPDC093105 TaxID=3366029 RepID=UPI0038038A32
MRSPWAGLLPTEERRFDEHGRPLDVWVPSAEPARQAEGDPVIGAVSSARGSGFVVS